MMLRTSSVITAAATAAAFGLDSASMSATSLSAVPPMTSPLANAKDEGLAGYCTPAPKAEAGKTVLYGFQARCTNETYSAPSTWVKQKGENVIYDVAIIGGGVGSAYLVNELKKQVPGVNAVIFEQAQATGGRLMSAYGSGALGNAVQDPAKVGSPPPEYGGMRLDPNGHWLVWDAVEEVVKKTKKNAKCGRKGVKKLAPVDPNLVQRFPESERMLGTEGDCDDYMVQMTTATMRYAVNEQADVKTFGEYLKKARMDDDGVIHNKCLSLIGSTQKYMKCCMSDDEKNSNTLDQAVQLACENCAKVTDDKDFCETCKLFPEPGKNLVSCIGYDDLLQVPVASSIIDAAVVTGQGEFNCNPEAGPIDKCANLYLFRQGAQVFAQQLLDLSGGHSGPIFGKRLTSFTIEGEDIPALAKAQAAKTQDVKGNIPSETPTKNALTTLHFADGSQAMAKMVYFTVLPQDLAVIEGLDAWKEPMREGMLPFGATKMFIYWSGGMPKEISDATKTGGIRLVTDGNRPGQMARQIFFWDPETILVYQTAPVDDILPANVMQEAAQSKGMDAVVGDVMEQLSGAFRKNLTMPDWVRVKPWGNGALSYYRTGCGKLKCESGAAFQSILQRPLGQELPIFYGNSEMSGGGGGTQGTGWIMGSFLQVQLHLQAMVDFLQKQK